jgi:hypothetical protein
MTCQEFWSRLQESPALLREGDGTAADRVFFEHTRGCGSCAGLMARQRALQAGLRRIAAEQAGLGAPARVETALLRQFRVHAGRAHAPAWASLAWLGTLTGRTLAAATATAVLAAVLVSYRVPLSRVLLPPSPSEVEDAASVDSGFVPLPYAGGDAPNAEAAVVRVEMPRSTLVALGVPLADQATSGTVEAELLLGPGGMPQAVRVIE